MKPAALFPGLGSLGHDSVGGADLVGPISTGQTAPWYPYT